MKKKLFGAALLAGTLGGCITEQPPEFLTANSPTNAEAGIQNVHHHSGLGSWQDRRPVEPKSWKKLNEEQSPKKEAH
jgi:hypothetical protein